MNITEAVERACQEPTLLDALTWICIWESERAIKQAKKLQDADGETWDTCFRYCLRQVMEEYNQTQQPSGQIVTTCRKCGLEYHSHMAAANCCR